MRVACSRMCTKGYGDTIAGGVPRRYYVSDVHERCAGGRGSVILSVAMADDSANQPILLSIISILPNMRIDASTSPTPKSLRLLRCAAPGDGASHGSRHSRTHTHPPHANTQRDKCRDGGIPTSADGATHLYFTNQRHCSKVTQHPRTRTPEPETITNHQRPPEANGT